MLNARIKLLLPSALLASPMLMKMNRKKIKGNLVARKAEVKQRKLFALKPRTANVAARLHDKYRISLWNYCVLITGDTKHSSHCNDGITSVALILQSVHMWKMVNCWRLTR